jgi:hypothetical protein
MRAVPMAAILLGLVWYFVPVTFNYLGCFFKKWKICDKLSGRIEVTRQQRGHLKIIHSYVQFLA